ncbi:MAG: outer membrane lipoprotein carrier protein LolA, partial [Pseudomonadota bacterium]
MSTIRLLMLACLAGASLIVPAQGVVSAEPVPETEGMALLEDYLANVLSMEARFEQSLVDANDIVIEESAGTVLIQRPGQFRWQYSSPYEQLLLADGLNIWSYDVDLEQVTVKPQAELLAKTPATLLGGGRDVLDEFEYVDSFRDDRGTVWLQLRPRNTDNGFTLVDIGFDDGVLQRMMFADSLDQTTLIALLDIQTNAPAA